MSEKTKMYTTLIVTWITITVLGLIIYLTDFNSDIVWSSDTSAAKKSMSASELEVFISWTKWEEVDDLDWNIIQKIDEETLEFAQSLRDESSENKSKEYGVDEISTTDDSKIPNEVNLDVTFYPQAPDADWSLPWKEACEESSVIQAYYYVQWKYLSKDTFRSEILSLVETQNNILWKYVDTSMEETAQFLRAQYGYGNYEIIDNPSVDDMKKELAKGHPIVAPFAWKLLWNIYFSDGGPRYHVLVIVWYDQQGFITNDVWTSRWENFSYSYETIMNAMHDLVPLWQGDILDWEKRILVLR